MVLHFAVATESIHTSDGTARHRLASGLLLPKHTAAHPKKLVRMHALLFFLYASTEFYPLPVSLQNLKFDLSRREKKMPNSASDKNQGTYISTVGRGEERRLCDAGC